MALLYDKTYGSVAEFAEVAEKHHGEGTRRYKGDFTGTESPREAYKLAREGWSTELEKVIQVAEDAVTKVEQTNDVPAWIPRYDVSGGSVDVGVFLTGEPECMVEVPPVRVAKVGKVITLCVSRAYSGTVSAHQVIRQGHVLTALALALQRLGYGFELILDITISRRRGGEDLVRDRCIVKGVNDQIDPEMLMFALAHPAFLRQLWFGVAHEMPESLQRQFGIGEYYGYPRDPVKDLPEGTIYTPSSLTGVDKDIAEQVTKYLRELDILV